MSPYKLCYIAYVLFIRSFKMFVYWFIIFTKFDLQSNQNDILIYVCNKYLLNASKENSTVIIQNIKKIIEILAINTVLIFSNIILNT